MFFSGKSMQRCVLARSASATSPPAQPPVKKVVVDPFLEKRSYNDNAFDRLFISIYTNKMAAKLPNVYVPEEPQYEDFVRVSKEIMKGRTPSEQKEVIMEVLNSLMPNGTAATFRRLFPPNQLSAELNAWFATLGFGWLVGEMELKAGDIKVSSDLTRPQRSIVKITKCRYLEASGCVGMCVNMCKVPTQTFFTEEFGLPLTMKPNFEDLSCEMIFGQPPEAMEVDEAFQQPCFAMQCSVATANKVKPCPKTLEPMV